MNTRCKRTWTELTSLFVRYIVSLFSGSQRHTETVVCPDRVAAGVIQHWRAAWTHHVHIRHHRHVRFRTREKTKGHRRHGELRDVRQEHATVVQVSVSPKRLFGTSRQVPNEKRGGRIVYIHAVTVSGSTGVFRNISTRICVPLFFTLLNSNGSVSNG